jgi:hypothetical protein
MTPDMQAQHYQPPIVRVRDTVTAPSVPKLTVGMDAFYPHQLGMLICGTKETFKRKTGTN